MTPDMMGAAVAARRTEQPTGLALQCRPDPSTGANRFVEPDGSALLRYGPRDDVFLEGDDADDVFEVMEGILCVYRILADGARHILAFRFPGDIIGLCSPAAYDYNVQAVGRARLRRIPRASLDRLIDRQPDLARRLLRMAAGELNEMRNHLMCLASKSAEAKVADFLVMLARRVKAEAGSDIVIHLPMTRTDIGDYLGLTIETVSRTVSKLRRAGVIDVPRPADIVVRDLPRLACLAGEC